MTTKNPKTVTVFRHASFLSNSQKGMEEYMSHFKQAVGGYWASTSSKAIGTGLTPTEVNILLPLLIDIHHEDREFRAKVKEFYEGLETQVPFKTGRTLKIGLHDDSKPLSKDNLPVDVMDYVRWKHAEGHPEVADSKEVAQGNPLIKFYIHDPNAVKQKNTSLRERREEAMELYLKLSKEKGKIDNVLALYGLDPRDYADTHDKLEELQKKIQSEKVEDLERFIDIMKDEDLAVKGFINKLVKVGVLSTIGTRYKVVETGKILADSLEEAVLELKDQDKNSELISVLKAKLQDIMKEKATKA